MKYYRVLKQFDNTQIYKSIDGMHFAYEGILVGNELYTIKEFEKIKNMIVKVPIGKVNNIEECFEVVEISKNDTFFFFGARFSV